MDLHDLSFRDLAALVAVAEHKHFGRAAESLRIAQPTLSAQVQKAERLIGVRLFDRAGRRFVITPEGQRVLPLVRDALAGAERLHAAAAESLGAATPLRLGVIPTLGPYLMPHVLISPREQPPALALSEQTTPSLERALLEGTIDAAILSLPIRSDSLASIPLFDEPFRLIAPRGSELLSLPRLAPSRLCIRDMVLLDEGHCLRDQALAVCGKRRGDEPRLIATSLETLKYVVASGGGYSLIPELASELPRPLSDRVVIRAFDERPPSRRIGLCFRQSIARRRDIENLAAYIRRRLPASVRAVRSS